MGLLDNMTGPLAGNLLSSLLGSGQSNLLSGVVSQLLSPQAGGLGGLMQAFQNNGMGNIMQSWISTGSNLPVSADQILSVLGTSKVQQVAQHLGVTPQSASSQLAEFLPQIIDKLTPDGQVPEQTSLDQAFNFLKGLK